MVVRSRRRAAVLGLLFLCGVCTLHGVLSPPPLAAQQLAFPTAEGFGQLAILGVTAAANIDNQELDDDAGTIGVSVNTSTAQYSVAVSSDDATTTADTKSLVSATAVQFLSATGAALFTGTWTSFDATGTTWNLSATNGTARKWWVYELELPSSARHRPHTVWKTGGQGW